MKRLVILGSVIAALGSVPGLVAVSSAAVGLTQSTTMTVQTNIIPAVTVTATVLDFGTVISGESSDSFGTVTVTASTGLPYTVGLNGGVNPTGGLRAMKNATGDFIAYKLFSDAGHQQEWGDDNVTFPAPSLKKDPTSAGSIVGNGGAQVYYVYGHMDTVKTVPPSVYTDTILVTVNY